jgi:hypothetical protein
MTAIRSERMPAPPSETTCFVAGAIAITSFVLLTWRGIALTPDGWAYWQGAVSIAEGRGYRLFSGGAIISWPPLYSLYLSQWTLVMGPTGRGLIVASAVLVGAQAWLWCHVLQNIWYEAEGAIHRPALFAVAIYLGLFIPLTQQYVLANVLEYTILPLLFLAIWRARRAEQASGILGWAAASGVAGSLLLLTHNGGVVFVGTCVLLIAVKGTERRNRVTAALLAGSLPIVVWMTVRHKLGQDGSHSVGFGGGRYAPSTYLQQFVWGLWELVKPSQRTPIIGLGALAVLIAFLVWRRVGRTSLVFGALFAGIAAGGTYVLFNVVWIYDKLDGRFILFIPIILVPLGADEPRQVEHCGVCRRSRLIPSSASEPDGSMGSRLYAVVT